ncbi:hypothetical protein D3C80_1252950 [compost metagenome]
MWPEVSRQRRLPFTALMTKVVPQRHHRVAVQPANSHRLAETLQCVRMCGHGTGIPIRTKTAHQCAADHHGNQLRLIQQGNGNRVRRRILGVTTAVAYRQRGIFAQ